MQNFVSAAAGMAVLVALDPRLRRAARRASIGNFWVDLTRGTLYILLPLSLVLALVLVSQGVVQTFAPYQQATLVEPIVIEVPATDADGTPQSTHRRGRADGPDVTEQTLPLGPAASQVAIKQLGTNGGGFFNVNSAHPFENPTPLSNFLEVLAILLIPAALCYTFGSMVGDTRQGWAMLAAMLVIFVPLLLGAFAAEQAGNPRFDALGVDQAASALQPGGNMEGKETRFGIANSALWATATTAASNGSVNAMHDSFTPLGGLVPMWLMQLGEVVFGGVGSGLYGMLMFAVVAVFIAGLMVGRTPEYLGKKIEAYEMKMAALVLLVPCSWCCSARRSRSCVPAATAQRRQSRAARLLRDPVRVLVGRQQQRQRLRRALGEHALLQPRARHRDVAVALLADDSGARHRRQPGREARDGRPRAGTLPTHTPLFVALLVGTVLLVGALTFVPALALGPDRRAPAAVDGSH